jgi:AraC-like DNA-binding protein
MPHTIAPRSAPVEQDVERDQDVGGARASSRMSSAIKMWAVPDRLRDLIDLVLDSLDDPGADGRALADRAHFSRDHLDRLLAAATGETPVALRRRLLLERAAWQLRTKAASPSEAAAAADYASLAAFSRAFSRA